METSYYDAKIFDTNPFLTGADAPYDIRCDYNRMGAIHAYSVMPRRGGIGRCIACVGSNGGDLVFDIIEPANTADLESRLNELRSKIE